MRLLDDWRRAKATITAAEAAVERADATIRLVSGGSDMGSRTRPDNQPPGPRELRFLLEMTLVYSNALKDTIAALNRLIVCTILLLVGCTASPAARSPEPTPSPAPTPVYVSQSEHFSVTQHFKGGHYQVRWQLFNNDTGKGLIVYLSDRTGRTVKELVSSGSDTGNEMVTIDEGDYSVTVATFVKQFTVTVTPGG